MATEQQPLNANPAANEAPLQPVAPNTAAEATEESSPLSHEADTHEADDLPTLSSPDGEAPKVEGRKFEMVAKTLQGLEDVLTSELINLGADQVRPGRRMVAFRGDLEMLYKTNICCRTALRILKPIWRFVARDTDQLYELAKRFDWGSILTENSTFQIDAVVYSDNFTNSRFVTYRVKDAIVDWFQDRLGDGHRPGVRLDGADVMINVHISGTMVTLSLDSSGESLHKRGYRIAQTEAPINEVLAAGIILKSGWRGDGPFVDPMCGSGTFLIEAALIACNINPGIYRRHFAFEGWRDFDADLFDSLINDDSQERPFDYKIYGSDISPRAIEVAERNIKNAGVAKLISLEVKPLSAWTEAPEGGILVTNPPYGERISVESMSGLYQLLGRQLKFVFKGYHAWVIAAKNEYIRSIGLSPSQKIPVYNGAIECELLEYVIFEGDYRSFRASGGRLRDSDPQIPARDKKGSKPRRDDARGKTRRDGARRDERSFADKRRERRADKAGKPRNKLEELYSPRRERSDAPSKPYRSHADKPSALRGDKPFGTKAAPKPHSQAPEPPRYITNEAGERIARGRSPEEIKAMMAGKRPSLPEQPQQLASRRKKKDQ